MLKRMIRFGKKGKLNLGYMGPFEILEIVGTMAYRLVLSSAFPNVHPIFHVYVLQKYLLNLSHVINRQPI